MLGYIYIDGLSQDGNGVNTLYRVMVEIKLRVPNGLAATTHLMISMGSLLC